MIIKPEHPKRRNERNSQTRLDPVRISKITDVGNHEFCQVKNYGIKYRKKDNRPYKAIWCVTHKHWIYEYPVKSVCTYTFADGEVIETSKGLEETWRDFVMETKK